MCHLLLLHGRRRRRKSESQIQNSRGGGTVFEITALCDFFFSGTYFPKKNCKCNIRHFSSEIAAFCGTLPTFNLSSNFSFLFFSASNQGSRSETPFVLSVACHSAAPVHAPMVGVIITKHNSLLFICPRGALRGICFLRREVALRWRCGNDRGNVGKSFADYLTY